MNNTTRLEILNSRIKQLECLVTAGEGESPLLKQLRLLREDIKTKAELDYVEVQGNVTNTWRLLMEQLASLSFFAKEADKDVRPITKAIDQMNKLKSTIIGDIITLVDKEEEEEGKVTSSVEDVKKVITNNDGIFFDKYEAWKNKCEELKFTFEREGNSVYSFDKDANTTGTFLIDEAYGYVFTTSDSYNNLFEPEE